MATFTVRIELHEIDSFQKPTQDDYEKLHAAMHRNQYYRAIKDVHGNWFQMPHATYIGYFDKTTKAVMDDVITILGTVWSKAGKLVTQASNACYIQGLIPISEAEANSLMSLSWVQSA